MRVTSNIPDTLINDLMLETGERNKTRLIKSALEEMLRTLRRKKLIAMSGKLELDLTKEELINDRKRDMIESYMIDPNVWINYSRHNTYKFTPFIKELMEKDQVYINGIIQIELLKGAKSEKNYKWLENSLNCLHFLEINKRLFGIISEATFKLRRDGLTVPLTDLVIAIQCIENDLVLIEVSCLSRNWTTAS